MKPNVENAIKNKLIDLFTRYIYNEEVDIIPIIDEEVIIKCNDETELKGKLNGRINIYYEYHEDCGLNPGEYYEIINTNSVKAHCNFKYKAADSIERIEEIEWYIS